jgi:hypothetical protein
VTGLYRHMRNPMLPSSPSFSARPFYSPTGVSLHMGLSRGSAAMRLWWVMRSQCSLGGSGRSTRISVPTSHGGFRG